MQVLVNNMFKLTSDWKDILKDEFDKDYYKNLIKFLEYEYQNYNIYPKKEDVFNALNTTSFKDVKVVIIGQDPYHEEGQAHGLAFSVLDPTPLPKSLINIYKEIESDIGKDINFKYEKSLSGNLLPWAKQGVLLINSVLTVREHMANSHKNKGWEKFTDAIIDKLNKEKEKVIFVLWGNDAKKKCANIDYNRHYVLTSAHPSPLSASRGFFGCKHFTKINKILKNNNQEVINFTINNR